jgi:hypothetical protein
MTAERAKRRGIRAERCASGAEPAYVRVRAALNLAGLYGVPDTGPPLICGDRGSA